MQNFTEIAPGKRFNRRLHAREVAKHTGVGRTEGYVSETVQDTASGTIIYSSLFTISGSQ